MRGDLEVLVEFSSLVEAQLCRQKLEAHSIPASVVNDHVAGLLPMLTPALGGYRVLVFAKDMEQATAVLEGDVAAEDEPPAQSADAASTAREDDDIALECPECSSPLLFAQRHAGTSHPCPVCGELLDIPGDSDDSAAALPSTDDAIHAPEEQAAAVQPTCTRPVSGPQLWFELGAVACIFILPSVYYTIRDFGTAQYYQPKFEDYSPQYCFDWLFTTVTTLLALLYILWVSGRPLEYFGLGKPRLGIDTLVGGGCFVLMKASNMVAALFVFMISPTFMSRSVTHMPTESYAESPPSPATWIGIVLAICVICAKATQEEIIFRGYLIPRLRELLNSPVFAVALSAAFFAFGHSYQGFPAVVESFVMGLIFGAVFLITGRVWPFAIAHSAHNLMALVHNAGQ